jgi:hypothetical protein
MQMFNLRLAAELGGRKLTTLHSEAMRHSTAMINIFVNAWKVGRLISLDQRDREMYRAIREARKITKGFQ